MSVPLLSCDLFECGVIASNHDLFSGLGMEVGLDVTILPRPLLVTTWHSAALERFCQRQVSPSSDQLGMLESTGPPGMLTFNAGN